MAGQLASIGKRAAVAATRRAAQGHAAFEAEGITVSFGGLTALDEVDLRLAQDEVLGLIGPNGAGKTTLVNVLSGFQKVTAGHMRVMGAEVTRWSPETRVRAGIARTFQNVRTFGELSVLMNVEVAAIGAGLRSAEARRVATELVELFELDAKRDAKASALSHGEERRLGVARALATRPNFLFLDEPAAGLDEDESDGLVETLIRSRENRQFGIMLIEHSMRVVMSFCERIQVLDHGRTICVGSPDVVRRDPLVIEAYLGTH